MKKKKKSSENDQSTGHFQSFFIYFFSSPPTLGLKKKSRKSTNKKNLALIYSVGQGLNVTRKYIYYLFACWIILHTFIVCQFFFSELTLKKNLSGIPSIANSLDQDQAKFFVRSDLGPKCLQRLSADDTSRQRVRVLWPRMGLFFQFY